MRGWQDVLPDRRLWWRERHGEIEDDRRKLGGDTFVRITGHFVDVLIAGIKVRADTIRPVFRLREHICRSGEVTCVRESQNLFTAFRLNTVKNTDPSVVDHVLPSFLCCFEGN